MIRAKLKVNDLIDSKTFSVAYRGWLGVALVAVIVGAGLRLYRLDERTMGHSESYVPGIDWPSEELATPGPRHTLAKVIYSTIHTEPHPPGYYCLMLYWNQSFGTSLFTIRLPSVLFGTSSIILIYLLGVRLRVHAAAALAALFWATCPISIFFDRQARMYPMACFCGLASTYLLLASYRVQRRRGLLMWAYVAVTLAGLFSTVFLWPIFLTHIVYTLMGPSASKNTAPFQARWQMLIFALGSPLLAIAAYQSGRPSYLAPDVWANVLSYLQFYGAFTSEYSPSLTWSLTPLALLVISLLLLAVVRLLAVRPSESRSTLLHVIPPLPPRGALIACAIVAAISIEAFAYFSHYASHFWPIRTWQVACCGIIPIAVAGFDYLLAKKWGLLARIVERLGAPLSDDRWLVGLLCTVPIALLAVATAMGLPLFADRTVYVAAPYFFLMIAFGIQCVPGRLFGLVPVVCVLVAANVAGLASYEERFKPPSDYARLSSEIKPHIRSDDLWFFRKEVWITPIFYYIDARNHRFVSNGHEKWLKENPDSRVWLLRSPFLPKRTESIVQLLREYRHIKTFHSRDLVADLYEPRK